MQRMAHRVPGLRRAQRHADAGARHRLRACALGTSTRRRQAPPVGPPRRPPSAELAALARGCANVAGRTTTRPTYRGALARVPSGMRQLYVASTPTTRRRRPTRTIPRLQRPRILPSIAAVADGADGRTLLFVPSYLEFVRVQALLKGEGVPFAAVSEYSTPKEASRARTRLQQGQLPLLLYTERAHFFRRHRPGRAQPLNPRAADLPALLPRKAHRHARGAVQAAAPTAENGGEGGGAGGKRTCSAAPTTAAAAAPTTGSARGADAHRSDQSSSKFC